MACRWLCPGVYAWLTAARFSWSPAVHTVAGEAVFVGLAKVLGFLISAMKFSLLIAWGPSCCLTAPSIAPQKSLHPRLQGDIKGTSDVCLGC